MFRLKNHHSTKNDVQKLNDEFKRVVEDNTKVIKEFCDFLKSLDTQNASK